MGSNPTPSAILLRAPRFAGFAAALEAKQVTLRSFSEEGLPAPTHRATAEAGGKGEAPMGDPGLSNGPPRPQAARQAPDDLQRGQIRSPGQVLSKESRHIRHFRSLIS